ncbi:PREDICTED: interferon alpha-inducible protein 27-like protein 2 [Propithecus coquereli]|uniref:interferon alpha-inducible protein 27-like protein 2 n=1 Tax=Propithecus coquereli TaxID=379532 RepID=UPI00063FB05C|nr:PREDICTED: interferon alpha-inducible protein 27-like protein 2 [Propithecus coquereli]
MAQTAAVIGGAVILVAMPVVLSAIGLPSAGITASSMTKMMSAAATAITRVAMGSLMAALRSVILSHGAARPACPSLLTRRLFPRSGLTLPVMQTHAGLR